MHPALGWNKATIFQQNTMSLLIVQGNKKKKKKEYQGHRMYRTVQNEMT